jgi:hypothetical protein
MVTAPEPQSVRQVKPTTTIKKGNSTEILSKVRVMIDEKTKK